MSAELIYTAAFGEGSPSPRPKQKMRECSRKRPTRLFTLMFSESSVIPCLRPQMPDRTRRGYVARPRRHAQPEVGGGLQLEQAVHHVPACLLHIAGEIDVGPPLEGRLELGDRRD